MGAVLYASHELQDEVQTAISETTRSMLTMHYWNPRYTHVLWLQRLDSIRVTDDQWRTTGFALAEHGLHNAMSQVSPQDFFRLACVRKLRINTLGDFPLLGLAVGEIKTTHHNHDPVYDEFQPGLAIADLASRFTGLQELHVVVNDCHLESVRDYRIENAEEYFDKFLEVFALLSTVRQISFEAEKDWDDEMDFDVLDLLLERLENVLWDSDKGVSSVSREILQDRFLKDLDVLVAEIVEE